MNKLKTQSGRIIHLTRDFDTYVKMKKQGYDVHLISRKDLDRKYPVTAYVGFEDWTNGKQRNQVIFTSLEDEIIYLEKITKNGKLTHIDYEN